MNNDCLLNHVESKAQVGGMIWMIFLDGFDPLSFQGSVNGTHFGKIKHCTCMTIFERFPL